MSDTPTSIVIPDDAEHQDGPFAGFLIRMFNLKPYGNSLYTAKAPGSIRGSSYVLLGVLIYEIFAPFLTVNYFANNTGELVFTYLSIVALIISIVPGGIVTWLDQSVMVLDTSEFNPAREKAWETLGNAWNKMKEAGNNLAEKKDNAGATGIAAFLGFLEGGAQFMGSIKLMAKVWIGSRLIIILLAAMVTATGIELFGFKGTIDKREYEEAIIAEAVHQAEELQKAEALAEEARNTEGTLDASRVDQAETLLEKAEARELREQQRVDSLDAEVLRLREELRQLELNIESSSSSSARRRLASRRAPLEQQLSETETKLAEAKEELADAKAQVKAQTQGVTSTSDEQRDRRDATEQSVEQRRAWMSMLVRGDINNLPDDPSTGMKFNVHSGGTVDRLAILDDIRHGRPPRWPDCSDETKQIVIATFPGVAPSPEHVDEERVMSTAAAYSWIYGIMHIVAILIPLAAVFWKLNYSKDAKVYYSMVHQARNGHPGAIKQFQKLHGDEVFRKEVLPHLAKNDPLLKQACDNEGEAQREFLTKYGTELYNTLVLPVAVSNDQLFTQAREGDEAAQAEFRIKYGNEYYNRMVLPVAIQNDPLLVRAREGNDAAQEAFYIKYGHQAFENLVVPYTIHPPGILIQQAWTAGSVRNEAIS